MNVFDGIENLQKVKQQLFEVQKVQLHPNIEGLESPLSYGVYKKSGGKPLGVVGKDYMPVNLLNLFNDFENSLLETDVNLNEVEFREFKDGAKVRFKAPLKTIGFTNLRGIQDESVIYLNLQTGFDGLTKTSIYLSMFRMVCTNGMKALKTEFTLSVKNTIGNTGKINFMVNDVRRAVNSANDIQPLLEQLNRRTVTQTEIDQYLLKVTGMDRKTIKDESTRKQNIFDSINKSVGLELSRTGNSLFGLLNGITHYTNHGTNKIDVEQHIFIESGLQMNDKAQAVALEMLN